MVPAVVRLLPAVLLPPGAAGVLPVVPLVVAVGPWYYWYGYGPWYPYPPLPFDPLALASLMMWPLYYALMFEMYRAVIETWKKAVEALAKPSEAR